ncbi:MAG: inverse autotransporter beta domain-containing protein [Alphaproteobacteria bacterium]
MDGKLALLRVPRSSRLCLGVIGLPLFLVSCGVASGPGQGHLTAAESQQFASNILQSAEALSDGNTLVAALQAADSAIDYLLPGLGDDGPDWLSRVEFEWDVQRDDKPEFSILTVQPLFQSEEKQDTFFTQLRAARNFTSGEYRTTTNVGLGYRRLFSDSKLLLGANAFIDNEWKNNHSRLGLGVEARWSGFDLYANYYLGLSGKKSAGGGITEEALDGYDLELTTQVPYLPWARVRGQYFLWDTKSLSENIDGYTGAVELDIHQNFQLEFGYTDDDFNDGFVFAKIRFTPGSRGRPTLLSDQAVSDQAFNLRDMRGYTLDKVRRVNNIVVERTSSGVTISRLN